ncbi:MAG: IS110 family transposase, partial [Chloroflexi bacterium]|nr:IS110 family transposase [Chloroflexota bacterium]
MHKVMGIDISKKSVHCCVLPQNDPDPKKWTVIEIDLSAPDWHEQLATLAGDCLVCLEPTGWHYARPIVKVLEDTRAILYQVTNKRTGDVRRAHVSDAKTDAMDARALAIIARMTSEGQAVRGVYSYNPYREQRTMELRLLVNENVRLTKQAVRSKNQLHAYLHSMWPILSVRFEIWQRAASAGAYTPQQIIDLAEKVETGWRPDSDAYNHGMARNALYALADYCHPLPVDDTTVEKTIQIYQRLVEMETGLAANELEIEHMIKSDPFAEVTRRLLTLPGASAYRIATMHVAARAMIDEFSVDEFKSAVGSRPK